MTVTGAPRASSSRVRSSLDTLAGAREGIGFESTRDDGLAIQAAEHEVARLDAHAGAERKRRCYPAAPACILAERDPNARVSTKEKALRRMPGRVL